MLSNWTGTDGSLNPLSVVEDRTDQMNPIDGIMGDSPDGIWDGDRRLAGFGGNLNPFDIDGNGRSSYRWYPTRTKSSMSMIRTRCSGTPLPMR